MSKRILAASGWVALALALVLLFYAVLAFEVLETRYLVATIAILTMCSGFALLAFGQRDAQKPTRDWPILAGVALLLLFYFWGPYTWVRPTAPVSIVMTACLALMYVGLIGVLFLNPIRTWALFGRYDWRQRVVRFVIVLLCFIILFPQVERGLGYALVALMEPADIPLTPEIARYVVPTVAALLLVCYRISSQIKMVTLRLLNRIAEDAILASLAILAYTIVIGSLGTKIVNPFGEALASGLILGLAVWLSGIMLEGWLISTTEIFAGAPGALMSIRHLLSFGVFLKIFEKGRQTFLLDYLPPEPRVEPAGVIARFAKKWAVSISARNKNIIGVLLLLGTVGLAVAFTATGPRTLIVPGWKIELSVTGYPVPDSAGVFLSDRIEFKGPVSFSVPLVHISAGNSSFVAPLSSRYLTLNSSSFSVLTTGEYLAVSIQMVPVWAEIQVRVFPSVPLNQTQNPAFSYFGLFRDAEAYYALYLSGYRTVFSICTQTYSGTTTSASKLMFAESADGRRILIRVSVQPESILPDETLLESVDATTSERVMRLVSSAGVSTSFKVVKADPTVPFSIATSPPT